MRSRAIDVAAAAAGRILAEEAKGSKGDELSSARSSGQEEPELGSTAVVIAGFEPAIHSVPMMTGVTNGSHGQAMQDDVDCGQLDFGTGELSLHGSKNAATRQKLRRCRRHGPSAASASWCCLVE